MNLLMQGPIKVMDAFCGAGNMSKAAQLFTAAAREADAGRPGISSAAQRGYDVRGSCQFYLFFLFQHRRCCAYYIWASSMHTPSHDACLGCGCKLML